MLQKAERAEYVKTTKLDIFQSLVALSKMVNRTGLSAADQTWQEKDAHAASRLAERAQNENIVLVGNLTITNIYYY